MQKVIAVSPEVYAEIQRLAEAGHRTMGGCVAWILDLLKQSKQYNVIKISNIAPDGAETVPLVAITPKELI